MININKFFGLGIMNSLRTADLFPVIASPSLRKRSNYWKYVFGSQANLRHTKLYSDIIPFSQKACSRIVFVKVCLLSCKQSLSHCKELEESFQSY